MIKQIIGICFACVAASSHALPIAVLGDDKLIGFDGIYDTDGSEYRVRFATGEFEDAFGMTKDEFRLERYGKNMYGQGVHFSLYDFFSSEEGHFFEQNPEYIYGCLEDECNIYTPWAHSDESPEYLHEHSAVNRWRACGVVHDDGTCTAGFDPEFPDDPWTWNSKMDGDTWAVWVEVPEPSSLLLLAPGIIALFVNRKRRNPCVAT